MKNLNDIKNEIISLNNKIEECKKQYNFYDNPQVEDYEYDNMKKKLENFSKEYPQFAYLCTSIREIGWKPSLKFSPVHHDVKMESLHDSFSIDDIKKFYDRVCEKFGESEFTVEKKIDGLSLSVEYQNGKLFRASTRGDGVTGEDITENALTIKNLPHKIDESIEYLEVRGECFMPKSSFIDLVKLQESEGKQVFKNPRNAAAGSIRQKDVNLCKSRNLYILFFNLQRVLGMNFNTHSETLEFLKNLGLPVVDFKICSNFEEIKDEIEKIGRERKNYSHQIDGAVLKLNDLKNRNVLGSTSSYPRWAEAFKYPPEVKKSICKSIEVKVGRTGILTPVCVFEPVYIDGTLISKASLHNEDFILSKNIRIGDYVYVIKSGDIIPEISKCEVNPSNDRNESFKMPLRCPSCGSEVFIDSSKEGKTYRCANENCKERVKSKILHFASRDAMNIEGFGEETFDILQDEVKSYLDIYHLNSNILKNHDEFRLKNISNNQEMFFGFDESIYINKTGRNLLQEIEKSKKNSLDRLVYGLGIPFVGKETANILSSHFENLDNLSNAKINEISSIDGIGDVTSQSIVEFFSKNIDLVNDLKELGINTKYVGKRSTYDRKITCCLTGKFEFYTRNELIKRLNDNGIKVSSSISKNVSYLICGKNPGSKLEQAKDLGVNIISEDQINSVLGI